MFDINYVLQELQKYLIKDRYSTAVQCQLQHSWATARKQSTNRQTNIVLLVQYLLSLPS